jgi:hypothetical protein
MRARGDLLVERHGAGLSDGIQAVEGDHGEHLHELPIAVGVSGKAFSQPGHGSR